MSWIITMSGSRFDYQNPTPESVNIFDIARALSHECRFAGHIPTFYSVAQHSVIVSKIVPPEFAFEALLHDAVEAYCKDIPSPLKRLLPDYQTMETRVDRVIRIAFNLPLEYSQAVKEADLIALATERRDLGLDDGTKWPMLDGVSPASTPILPMSPNNAYLHLIARFEELSKARLQGVNDHE